jgi:predicted phosphodiesterase
MTSIKIAVMSDLHFYDEADPKPSYLQVSGQQTAKNNPIYALEALIKEESLSVDFLLCAGDLTDKANPKGLREGWRLVNDIGSKLNAVVIATAGNHDLDSRLQNDGFDAKGELLSLKPLFPVDDDLLFNSYWARNYVIYEPKDLDVRFLILNSAAYHGYDKEYVHGRVSDRTIDLIKDDLANRDPRFSNILVCHHHPHKHGEIGGDGYSAMKGGEALIDLLGQGDFGDWIIIHGHRHVPKICYTAGGANSPTVFSAGSFGAVLYDEIQGLARNQFYVIEIPLDEIDNENIISRGQFKAWDWIQTIGWQLPGKNSGLPANGGFGYRGNPKALAKKIKRHLESGQSPYVDYIELEKLFIELKYLLPMDMTKLKLALEEKGVNVEEDQNLSIRQVALKAVK